MIAVEWGLGMRLVKQNLYKADTVILSSRSQLSSQVKGDIPNERKV